MKLLLIDDEKKLLNALTYLLENNGYEVDSATDGETGYNLAATGHYDIIVLERILPVMDGIAVLTALRGKGFNTPVLFLTAKDTWQERVKGLDAGADDYIVKPFCADELLARLRVLCRRREKNLVDINTIRAAGLTLDLQKTKVVKGKEVIDLSIKESLLLGLLMRNSGQILTKEYIYEKIWGYNANNQLTSIDNYIHHLRKKLNVSFIKTIRGRGYLLQEGEGTG
jgi:DNA-binding response OmpR family regulator